MNCRIRNMIFRMEILSFLFRFSRDSETGPNSLWSVESPRRACVRNRVLWAKTGASLGNGSLSVLELLVGQFKWQTILKTIRANLILKSLSIRIDNLSCLWTSAAKAAVNLRKTPTWADTVSWFFTAIKNESHMSFLRREVHMKQKKSHGRFLLWSCRNVSFFIKNWWRFERNLWRTLKALIT